MSTALVHVLELLIQSWIIIHLVVNWVNIVVRPEPGLGSHFGDLISILPSQLMSCLLSLSRISQHCESARNKNPSLKFLMIFWLIGLKCCKWLQIRLFLGLECHIQKKWIFRVNSVHLLPSWGLPFPPHTLLRSTACHQKSHSSACSSAEKGMQNNVQTRSAC